MPRFYVNKYSQSQHSHEIHTTGCSFLPFEKNRIFLGNLEDCKAAIIEAQKYFKQVNGCYYCSKACHTE